MSAGEMPEYGLLPRFDRAHPEARALSQFSETAANGLECLGGLKNREGVKLRASGLLRPATLSYWDRKPTLVGEYFTLHWTSAKPKCTTSTQSTTTALLELA